MKIRPRPKHARRSQNKSRTSRRRVCDVLNRLLTLIEPLVHRFTCRQQPTELTIVLRLINILGLALIVVIVSLLSKNGNIKEIIDLGKDLFNLLP
jgi:hypothetical protein